MSMQTKIHNIVRPTAIKIAITAILGITISSISFLLAENYYNALGIPTDSSFASIGIPPFYYISITDEIVLGSPSPGFKPLMFMLNCTIWYISSVAIINIKEKVRQK